MPNKKRLAMLVAGTIGAMFLVAACAPAAPAPTQAPANPVSEPTKAPAAAPTAAAAPAGGTIKIGFGAPLTGDQALFGKTLLNGAQLAANEVNAAGGLLGKKLELVPLDDQADPKQGPVVAQRFADDKSIVAVIGHFNSGVTIPAAPVYNKARLAHVTTSTNPKITQLGFDTVFRPIANDNMQGGTPADYAINVLKAKKAAVVHDKQAFGQGVSDVFEKRFKELGGTVTSVNGITATDTDFSAVVTKIKNENPDVIQFGGTHVAGGLLLKQLRAQGLKQPFMAPDGCYTPEFIQVAGKENAEGALVTFQIPPYDATPATKKFADDYKKSFNNEEPGPYSGSGYDQAKALIAGIKAANSADREAVVKAMRGVKIDGLYGPIEFDATGEVKEPAIFIFQVKDGKFDLVK
ncbi:MAG: branched-chain amino acid ABC transporter substrate-binding protein [Sphingomonadaceae bacterium]